MELPSSLIKEFASVTNDAPDKTDDDMFVYGTIVKQGDEIYAKLDGSEYLTPITTTMNVSAGDRVMVMVRNHSATVFGNVTSPGATSSDLAALSDETAAIAEAASNAMTAANGKNRNIYQAQTPAGTDWNVGDTWFNTANGNAIKRWDGSAWVDAKLSDAAMDVLVVAKAILSYLDVGSLTAGDISALLATFKKISSKDGTTYLNLEDGILNGAKVKTGYGKSQNMTFDPLAGSFSSVQSNEADVYTYLRAQGLANVDTNGTYRSQLIPAKITYYEENTIKTTYGWYQIPAIFSHKMFVDAGEVLGRSQVVENKITKVDDWNTNYDPSIATLKTPVRFLYGYNAENSPANNAHLVGMELNYSATHRVQVVFRTNAASSNPIYVRHCANGEWLGWGQITASAPAT